MSEIRDKVIYRIRELLFLNTLVNIAFQGGDITLDEVELFLDYIEREILSHPNWAIVDREAELPPLPELSKQMDTPMGIYRQAQAYMLKAGWVKEIGE